MKALKFNQMTKITPKNIGTKQNLHTSEKLPYKSSEIVKSSDPTLLTPKIEFCQTFETQNFFKNSLERNDPSPQVINTNSKL